MKTDNLSKKLRWIIFGLPLLVATLAWGEESAPTAPVTQTITKEGDYVIGVDDQIQVTVWRNPDLSITVPVRPDGKISTPLVGDVTAAGRTPMDLAAAITNKLGKFIRDPQVSVVLIGLSSHEYISRVRVTGAVRSPLSVPYRKGMTILDLVLQSGGPNEFASKNRTILYREKPDGSITAIPIKLEDILEEGKLDTNMALQPGDVITVPERLL